MTDLPPRPLDPAELLAHRAWMRRFAAALAGAEGEDLVQEAWVRVLSARAPALALTRPRAWLASVLRNAARMGQRGAIRREQREAQAACEEALAPTDELVAQAELEQLAVRAVLALSAPYRQALLLRYVRGLEPSEIARELELPPSTVRNRIARGLAEVRQELDRRHGRREAWLALLAPRTVLGKGTATMVVTPAALATATILAVTTAFVAHRLILRTEHDGGAERSGALASLRGASSVLSSAPGSTQERGSPTRREPIVSSSPTSVDRIAEASIEAKYGGYPLGTGVIQIRVEPRPIASEPLVVWLEGRSPEVASYARRKTASSEGTVAFEQLAAGTYRARASNSGNNYLPEAVELGADEVREVVLRPGTSTLRGRITCAGEPVAGIDVSARPFGGEPAETSRGVVARSGEYRISGLMLGRYELIVGGPSVLRQYFQVELDARENWLDVELPAGRITGRLVGIEFLPDRPDDESGFDRRHVLVFPRGWYQESGGRGLFLETQADGRFEARGLPPDDYVVWVNHRAKQRVWPVQTTITAEHPLQDVMLQPANALARIEGHITDAPEAGGLLVAVLRLDPQGVLRTGYAQVGARGAFEEEVDPGSYGLLVSGFNLEVPFTWVSGIVAQAGAPTKLDIALSPSRAVSIRLDAGKEWTPRSVWRLRMPTGEWLSYILFIGSEAEGRRAHTRPFRLPFGDYTVEADFGDPAPVVRKFTVVSGDGVQEIVLERP